MLKKIKNLILATSALFMLGSAVPALAGALDCSNPTTPADQVQCGANTAAGGASNANPESKLGDTITSVVNILSIVIGVIAVIVMIIAGLTFITSAGNEQKVSQAKSTIIYAVVGLIVVAFAQIIVRFTIHTATCNPKTDKNCTGYCEEPANAKTAYCKNKADTSGGGSGSGGSSGGTGGGSGSGSTPTTIQPAPKNFQ